MTIKLGDVIESSPGCREGSTDAAHRNELYIDSNVVHSIAVIADNNQP